MKSSVATAADGSAPVIERVSSRTIPGPLVSANKGAIDWGWQSLLAYGSCNQVVVVDTRYLGVYQTLGRHASPVVKVKWARERHYHDTDRLHSPVLASADTSGRIVIWNVASAREKCVFHEDGSKQLVLDLEWASSGNDEAHNLIVVLHHPNVLSVLNADNGTAVWRKHLQGELRCFAMDPFDGCNISFLSGECILVLDDFRTDQKPASNGRKFYISNVNQSAGTTTGPLSKGTSNEGRHGNNTRGTLRRRMRFLIKADHKNDADTSTTLSACVQILYHQTRRHHLLLVFPREVLILDLAINQTVGIVVPERNGSSFAQVFSCWQRDVLFCRHESGSVALRMKSPEPHEDPDGAPAYHSAETSWDVGYSLQCQSDTLRPTRHVYVAGMAICPVTESKVALVLNDGRVLIQELHRIEKAGGHDVLKLILTGSCGSISSPPHVIRMCPPVTFRNWPVYDPLLAVGCTNGAIQIFRVATGAMEKEMSVHTAPVRGIEWVSLKSFLSYAYPNLSSGNGLVRNELMLTDITRGHSIPLRTDREDESPIEMLRVSYLRHYVIIAFKDEPFELWDLHRLSLLRTMPKKFPMITALEWSPLHSRRHSGANEPQQQQGEKDDPSSAENILPVRHETAATQETKPAKEHFVFTDTDGQLYHFSVEGSLVRDNSRIPPDSGMGSITCIAWKSDQVVLGDVDGNLNLWDLKAKKSRGIETHRGWIKKIRFSPGRGNLRILVLYNDGVDLWDIKEVQLISQVKCTRDYPKVLDVDWASSDRPILAVVDGCIHITDINLKASTSPLQDYQPVDRQWCPSVLSPKTVLSLKAILEHHQMRDVASMTKEDGVTEEDVQMLHQQSDSLEEYLVELFWVKKMDTAKHCAHVARLFGDEEACHFWTVASHALRKQMRAEPANERGKSKVEDGNEDDEALEGNYDMFCDNRVYRRMQLARAALHESKRTTYAHTKNCAETLILLGETDKAVQLLLETEADNEGYYTDCLKACLVTSVRSSSASQSVIKLVATNLIAGGHILEGAELLCLIDKSLDACRYLQSAGRWEKAAWLAKATLPDAECAEVMRRWADHLCSSQVNRRSKALLLMLSTRDFRRVLVMLHSFGMTQRAALFLEACFENGVLGRDEPLAHTILTDYAHFLTSLGNYKCALEVCIRVGDDVADARELREKLLALTQNVVA